MLFSSLIFLCYFLPISIGIYYLSPKKARNYLLIFFSLFFYAWGGISYSVILVGSVLLNFLFAKQIDKNTHQKKLWLYSGLATNLIILVVFKYLDFIIENINSTVHFTGISQASLPLQNIALPLGISFFTFQQMSMLWDIYRNQHQHQLKLSETALYISLFPQLVAGPIVRYNDIIDQIKQRKESIDLFYSGVQRFILGLFKKVVIANTCASIADSIMNNKIDDLSTPAAWLGIVAYTFQIYFDFSGYSDMAIGLGRIFGFRILENFNFPYIATSIKEFWRRWHISLSSWFKDYVYIPLGGNRTTPQRTYVNLMIVFLLTGFWHGATWSFVFWGVFHGAFLIAERLGFEKLLQKMPKIVSWSYTILIVMIGWVFFRIEHFADATSYVFKLFGGGTKGHLYPVNFITSQRLAILILAALSSSVLLLKTKDFLLERSQQIQLHLPLDLVKNMVLIGMLFYAIMSINSGSYNPFIYFKF